MKLFVLTVNVNTHMCSKCNVKSPEPRHDIKWYKLFLEAALLYPDSTRLAEDYQEDFS